MSRVYIGRLPARCTERDIEKFFKGYGRLRDIVLKTGYGFVEFDDERDAEDAVYDLHGRELKGERIVVEHARLPPGRGSSRRRESRYGPPTRTDYRVIVENLSSRVSWQDLKDMMRKAGEVTYADAHKQVRNEGIVEFATYDDMKAAISKYDGYMLYERRLKVYADKPRHRSRSRSRRSRSGRSPRRGSRRDRSRSDSRRRSSTRRSRSDRGRSRRSGRSHSDESRKSRSRSRSHHSERSVSRHSNGHGSSSVSRNGGGSAAAAKARSHSASRERSRSPSHERSRSASRGRSKSGSRNHSRSPSNRGSRSGSDRRSRSRTPAERSRSISKSRSRSRSVSDAEDSRQERVEHSVEEEQPEPMEN